MSARSQSVGRGILDTSTVVELGRLPDARDIPAEPLITAVTLAELAVGPLVARDDDERDRRQAHLQQAEADIVALPFDEEAVRAFASVAVSLRGAGRTVSARTFDALIAAIAVSNVLAVHTCNPGDFAGIARLEVVTVSVPE